MLLENWKDVWTLWELGRMYGDYMGINHGSPCKDSGCVILSNYQLGVSVLYETCFEDGHRKLQEFLQSTTLNPKPQGFRLRF